MLRAFWKRLAYGLASLAVVGSLTVGTAAAFDPFGDVCSRPGAGGAACSEDGSDKISGPEGIIIRAANILALISSITAVIIILIAGFSYVTAAGDSSKLEQARSAITYAVVGLVVIVAARAIILFVINRL